MAGVEVSSGSELGLDLGSNSLGWCAVRVKDATPEAIVDCGVRIFEAGMEGDIEAGKGESRAAIRAQSTPSGGRSTAAVGGKAKVIHQLQRMGLLPSGKAEDVIPCWTDRFSPSTRTNQS